MRNKRPSEVELKEIIDECVAVAYRYGLIYGDLIKRVKISLMRHSLAVDGTKYRAGRNVGIRRDQFKQIEEWDGNGPKCRYCGNDWNQNSSRDHASGSAPGHHPVSGPVSGMDHEVEKSDA